MYKRREGYALPAVVVTSFIAATLTAAFLMRVSSSSQNTTDLIQRRQVFYTTDGMSRIVIREVEAYMMENDDPTTEDLQDPSNIPPPALPGYTLESYELTSTGDAFDGPIPNGPFEGMHAHQKPIGLTLLTRRAGTDVASQVELQVTLGQISMFQFFVFADDYIELYPGPNMTVNPGRLHANNDICLGSDNTLKLGHVTSAGRILASDARCRRQAGQGFHLYDGSTYKKMDSSLSNGCSSCGGTSQAWRAFAVSHWKGHAKDHAHGVTRLRVPISGEPEVQAGLDAAAVPQSNVRSARFLVDPVRPSDSQDVVDQKMAWKADLRIIDGVWYLNDGTWPGTPIWSDHPGSYITTNASGIEGDEPQAVGQADLAASLGWTQLPSRFSFYDYDTTRSRLSGDSKGVVSYGTLYRSSSSQWKPGFWATGAKGKTYTDSTGYNRAYFCGRCAGASCSGALALRASGTSYCTYSSTSGDQSLLDAQYLQGARGGFVDERIYRQDGSRGLMLPINFDVTALATALADTTPGELGSYFVDRPFNGIVYITSTWSGALDGDADELASLWPAQGGLTDSGQTKTYTTAMVQQALPAPLCSQDLGQIPGTLRVPFSGPPLDSSVTNGYEPYFTIPSCDTSRNPLATPNAVRVINAATVDEGAFPAGLSIVTNLPLYGLGGLNTSSNTTDGDAEPWVPFLLAADSVSLLSTAWDDKNDPWDRSIGFTSRVAAATTYNLEMLGGLVQTVDADHYSGGIENYPRFLENWSNVTTTVRGSFVVGFSSVYARQPWYYGSPVYNAPNREWGFDDHLRLLANQPPGTPLLSVHSVSRLIRM